ncbi:protein kinase C-binding protein NELL2-like protein [Cricetulus griseus]|uniref:Protein kinase C-binding protein NELL2-like protein n=1 Tax=Cricetulus griseus TaxID=10029 RepID=A0A061IIR7_CRIGR|nr:protein kinase C-binding protein NELL2-like protein [Cricetulus griseus]
MHAMESRVLLRTFCVILGLGAVWGLGVDPSLQIDVLTELELGESTAGVRQVPGLHNGTKAFLFQDELVLHTFSSAFYKVSGLGSRFHNPLSLANSYLENEYHVNDDVKFCYQLAV